MVTALDVLQQSGTTLASDTAEYNDIRPFNPIDATTNPSLVFAGVSKPEYEHLMIEAIEYASVSGLESIEEQTELALDRLLVQLGVKILNIIPGRVSLSVDPRLAYDKDAIIRKGTRLASLVEELDIPRERILVKIPATYPGILAAHALENAERPIATNLTLVFGRVQALACAQAGLSVISPFIGRVKDWWMAHHDGSSELLTGEKVTSSSLRSSISQHPGILLVRGIRAEYTLLGYKTQVMAAGFRSVDEIVELCKYGPPGGPDLVTLPPNLIQGLKEREGVLAEGLPDTDLGSETLGERRYISFGESASESAALFARDIELERIAADKVPEGLEKFSADMILLEGVVRGRLEAR